jgi:hypothetical protein
LLEIIVSETDPIYEVDLGYHPILSLPEETVTRQELPGGEIMHRLATPRGELSQITRPFSGHSSHFSRLKPWVESPEDVCRFLSLQHQPTLPDVTPVLETRRCLIGRALTMIDIAEPLQCVESLLGQQTLCLWSLTERDLLNELLDVLMSHVLAHLDFLLQQGLGPVFRLAGSELAIPPLMSLESGFMQLSAPYAKTMIDKIHMAGQAVILHCHGKVKDLLPIYLDLGADGTDPCEAPPYGDLDLANARQRTQGQLSLWGNIQYGDLAEAVEDEIEELVKDIIATGAPDGGFVLVPTARLYEKPLPDKTRKNLLRFIQAGRKYGEYPICLQMKG